MLEELKDYFYDKTIIIDKDEEFLFTSNGKLYPMYTISNEEKICISFYILDDHVLIDIIKKCTEEPTRELLEYFIEFFKWFDVIKYIEIDSDNSTLIIENIDISLRYLSLLIYGQTYYNRLGFGEQTEWSTFILEPILKLLDKIECQDKDDFINLFNINNNMSISNTFNYIKEYLNIASIRDLIIIKNIILCIFRKNNNNMYMFVPSIDNNLKLYL